MTCYISKHTSKKLLCKNTCKFSYTSLKFLQVYNSLSKHHLFTLKRQKRRDFGAEKLFCTNSARAHVSNPPPALLWDLGCEQGSYKLLLLLQIMPVWGKLRRYPWRKQHLYSVQGSHPNGCTENTGPWCTRTNRKLPFLSNRKNPGEWQPTENERHFILKWTFFLRHLGQRSIPCHMWEQQIRNQTSPHQGEMWMMAQSL